MDPTTYLSSSDNATEILAEQDQLDQEISKRYIQTVENDPDSKNFGDEFSTITAHGTNKDDTNHTKFNENKETDFAGVRYEQMKENINIINDHERHDEPEVKIKDITNEKTPFEIYFNDKRFVDVKIENIEPRTLVKRVLKSGTGLTLKEMIYGKRKSRPASLCSKMNKPLDINKVNNEQTALTNLQIGLKVSFHYAAYFEYEKAPFDSTQARGEPWTEVLGLKKLIPALENSLLEMRLNEKAVILSKYDLCYGENGCGDRIPRKKDCLFKIWLSGVSEMSLLDQFLSLNYQGKVQAFKAAAVQGSGSGSGSGSSGFSLKRIIYILDDQSEIIKKDFYRADRYAEAQKKYQNLLKILDDLPILDDESMKLINQKQVQYSINAGLCCLNRKKYKEAVKLAESANKIFETEKAFYIIGKGNRMRKHYNLAGVALKELLKRNPKNQDALKEIDFIERDKRQDSYDERKTFGNIFQNNRNAPYVPKNSTSESYTDSSTIIPDSESGLYNLTEIPESFKKYCQQFLEKFISSNERSIRSEPDRRFSFSQMAYLSECCEEYDFDANIEVDDGCQFLRVRKI